MNVYIARRCLLSVFLLLLCAFGLLACRTPAPTPSEEPNPPTEMPEEPGDTPPDAPIDVPEKYVYDEKEYTAPLSLFGEWSEYFLPGQRNNLYATEVTQNADGTYTQSRPAVEIDGPRTYASVDRPYAAAMHVNVDAYIVPPEDYRTYVRAGYDVIGTSGSFNKSAYSDLHPEVLQRNRDGSTDGLWNSLVLTREVLDFNITNSLREMTSASNWSVGFVEPEMFRAGLYGTAYKALWEMKYGESWSDPLLDARSVFLSQRLNIWTHTNAIKVYASYINKSERVEHKYSLAPHSTLAYTAYPEGITDGFVHMMGTGQVETVTGQVWSNTITNAIRYEGKKQQHTFVNAYVEYGTFLDAVNYYNTDFYALCDPMSDTYTSRPEDYWRELCHQQLVASMMYSDINRWELIWTNRSFMNVSADYRSEQLNIHNALLEISGAAYRATAGTPGVTYLLGDTLSWQPDSLGALGENAYDGFWGVAAPLVYDGIPLRTKAMELITSPDDLADVSVLIVSYDNQKPLYEQTNQAIADWVAQGGTLLYLGGPDAYLEIEEAWWNQSGRGGSPTADLLIRLGLADTVIAEMLTDQASELRWLGGSTAAGNSKKVDGLLRAGGDAFTYCYEGEGFEPLLQTENGKNVGIMTDVGEGRVLMVGLSTTDYSDSAAGADLIRMLTALALEHTEYDYVTSDVFLVERGDYTAVYPLHGSYTLKGSYVNIFSSDLSLVNDPVIAEGEAALYKRVRPTSSLSKPTLMLAGGVVQQVTEQEDVTTVTLYAAENALIPVRIAAPDGMAPVAVGVRHADKEAAAVHSWDAETNSICVMVISTPTAPATLTVRWEQGGTPVQNTAYESFTIATNAAGEDAPYIVENTANANGSMRYCDMDSVVVWGFDVSDYRGVIISADVLQNYILEISGDRETWTEIVDYSRMSSIRATGTNHAVYTILPDAYEGVGDIVYIRLRNTDPSKGWGGAIRSFTFSYIS